MALRASLMVVLCLAAALSAAQSPVENRQRALKEQKEAIQREQRETNRHRHRDDRPQRSEAFDSGPGAQCLAHPACATSTCKSVQENYTGADAMSSGARDIVRRCRAANAADSCCRQQCTSAAKCSATVAKRQPR